MPKFAAIDAAILDAIRAGKHPFYWRACNVEAAKASNRLTSERLIDRRLQSMRKRGIIWHATKADLKFAGGSIGWRITAEDIGTVA